MKKSSAVFLLAFVVGLSATGKTQSKATDGQAPLTTEELKLYGDFLDSFLGTSGESTPIQFFGQDCALDFESGGYRRVLTRNWIHKRNVESPEIKGVESWKTQQATGGMLPTWRQCWKPNSPRCLPALPPHCKPSKKD